MLKETARIPVSEVRVISSVLAPPKSTEPPNPVPSAVPPVIETSPPAPLSAPPAPPPKIR